MNLMPGGEGNPHVARCGWEQDGTEGRSNQTIKRARNERVLPVSERFNSHPHHRWPKQTAHSVLLQLIWSFNIGCVQKSNTKLGSQYSDKWIFPQRIISWFRGFSQPQVSTSQEFWFSWEIFCNWFMLNSIFFKKHIILWRALTKQYSGYMYNTYTYVYALWG